MARTALFKKNYREKCKRGYKVRIEDPYMVEKFKVQKDIFKAMTKFIVR